MARARVCTFLAFSVGLLIAFLAAPTSGQQSRSKVRGNNTAVRFVVRSAGEHPPWLSKSASRPCSSLILRSLQNPEEVTRFDFFTSDPRVNAMSAETYLVSAVTRGRLPSAPRYAVFAEWQIERPELAGAFERSRQELFAVRQRHIDSFHSDWLLKSVSGRDRYVVLGMYRDEAGLKLAREHPEVRGFIAANPAAKFYAKDLHGVKAFQIVRGEAYKDAKARPPNKSLNRTRSK